MHNKLHEEEEQIGNYKKKERKKMVQCAKKKKICNCNGRNQRAMQIDYKKKKKKKKKMMMLMISDVVAGMGFRKCKQACRLHTQTDGDLEEESER